MLTSQLRYVHSIKGQIIGAAYVHRCQMPKEGEGVCETKCSVASTTFQFKAFPHLYSCLSWQAPLFPTCRSCCSPSKHHSQASITFQPATVHWPGLLHSPLLRWPPRGGSTAGEETARGEQVRPAVDSIATQKTLCAPTLSNRELLLALLHVTSVHSENIPKRCWHGMKFWNNHSSFFYVGAWSLCPFPSSPPTLSRSWAPWQKGRPWWQTPLTWGGPGFTLALLTSLKPKHLTLWFHHK